VIRLPSRSSSLLACACFATFGARAHAEPSRAALTVTRSEGAGDCPDAENLGTRAELVAGKRLFDASPAAAIDTWVSVAFVRELGRVRGVITARGAREGTRTLEDVGPECASLSDAVAITLAILLDPVTARNELAARPALGVGGEGALRAPVDSPPKPAAKAPDAPRTFAFGVEGSAGASLAILDGFAPIVELGARARTEGFALGAGGGFVFPDAVPYGAGRVDVSLAFGSVRGCVNLLPERRTALEACLEPMLGGLYGAGHDYDVMGGAWVFWSAAAGGFQAYGPIAQSFAWFLRVRVLAPFVRHGFSVKTDGLSDEAFRLSSVGGSLSLGLAAEL
jgi:hypothetical protein